MTLLEVRPPHPRAGRYVSWQAYRHGFPHVEPVWRVCPECWGQGRILDWHTKRFYYCPTCIGFREVPSL